MIHKYSKHLILYSFKRLLLSVNLVFISNTNNFIGRIEDINLLVKKYYINEIIIPEEWGSIKDIIKIIDDLKSLKINFKLVPIGKKLLVGQGNVENIKKAGSAVQPAPSRVRAGSLCGLALRRRYPFFFFFIK